MRITGNYILVVNKMGPHYLLSLSPSRLCTMQFLLILVNTVQLYIPRVDLPVQIFVFSPVKIAVVS